MVRVVGSSRIVAVVATAAAAAAAVVVVLSGRWGGSGGGHGGGGGGGGRAAVAGFGYVSKRLTYSLSFGFTMFYCRPFIFDGPTQIPASCPSLSYN